MRQRTRSTVPPMPHVRGVTHRWIDVEGLSVHVAEAGQGTPLVLLHGWPQHWYCWRHVVEPLSAEHRLIMPDLRGMGWTEAPADGYEKEQLATDLLGLLDALELETVTLVGHDWGGWVGFLAALREPIRFDAFLALGILHPFQNVTIAKALQSWRFGYQLAISAPFAAAVLERSSLPIETALRLGSNSSGALGAPDGVYSNVLRQPGQARASVQMYRTFLGREVARLDRYRHSILEVPTRLLLGESDPIYHPALIDGWQGRARSMSVRTLPGVGHFIPEEAPAAVIAEVLALISEVN
jgi:pimeloyl-ACP methyl ester carboxylesterase